MHERVKYKWLTHVGERKCAQYPPAKVRIMIIRPSMVAIHEIRPINVPVGKGYSAGIAFLCNNNKRYRHTFYAHHLSSVTSIK